MRPFSQLSCLATQNASAPRGFCLIRYSVLIGCFNKVLRISISVKCTILPGKKWYLNFFFPRTLCHRRRNNIWKQILHALYNFLKKLQNINKNISLKATFCFLFFFYAKMRKSHYKIDIRFFSSCRTTQLMVTDVRSTINVLVLFCKLLL